MDDAELDELVETLVRLAADRSLEGARARELIPDGVPASPVVRCALDAAVAAGIAIGLRDAADLIVRWRGDAEPQKDAE